MRAVEFRQPKRVARKVRRRPVENHADPRLMAAVDELHEFRGRSVAAGRREVSDRLVAPRAVERMLHDRQQLDVRVAELLHVGNQLIAEFAIREPAIAFFRHSAATRPGALRRSRSATPASSCSCAASSTRASLHSWVSSSRHDRSGVRPQLGAESVRIGLQRQHLAARPDDFVLVDRAFVQFRDEQFPHAR